MSDYKFIPISESIPPVTGWSYGCKMSKTVAVIHSDRPDYPLTAHMTVYESETNCPLGICIKKIVGGKEIIIGWHFLGDAQNPFGLKNRDYTRFSPARFTACITHWAELPNIPSQSDL